MLENTSKHAEREREACGKEKRKLVRARMK